MKRTLTIIFSVIFISSTYQIQGQELDTTSQQENVLPPTQKSKQSESATRYSTPPKSNSDWKKKIFVGGYVGLSFGTYTNVDVSPLVGYNFTKDFSMGIGVIYNYFAYDVPAQGGGSSRYSSSNWGGRINANYTLFNLVVLGAEYQYLTVDTWSGNYTDLGEPIYDKEAVNILFLGGGIRQKVGNNASVFVMAYYDVLQDSRSPYYNNGIVWRIGVAAGF